MTHFIRSKTFDPSLLSQVQSDTEAKLERKKSHSNQVSVSTKTKKLKVNAILFSRFGVLSINLNAQEWIMWVKSLFVLNFSTTNCSKSSARMNCWGKVSCCFCKMYRHKKRSASVLPSPRKPVQCVGWSVYLWSSGYTCALQKDILYQGRLFVSDNWICFHSKVFGRDTKVWTYLLAKQLADNIKQQLANKTTDWLLKTFWKTVIKNVEAPL